jgi:ABC-type nitrate/sulfonate/bicarbonate transport system permease component
VGDWDEQARRRDDRKRSLQLLLVGLGVASLLGSVAGAAFGLVRTLAGVMDEAEESL